MAKVSIPPSPPYTSLRWAPADKTTQWQLGPILAGTVLATCSWARRLESALDAPMACGLYRGSRPAISSSAIRINTNHSAKQEVMSEVPSGILLLAVDGHAPLLKEKKSSVGLFLAFLAIFSGSTLRHWRAARPAAGTFLLSMLLISCQQPPREPVTLRYPHGWRFEPDEISKRAALTQEFTQQTGIQIREMPQPETTFDQLDLDRKLLKPGSSGIDLLGIDLIWSATLESDLVDLAPYSTTEISSIDQQLLPNYAVDGKLVAIPYQVNVGTLEYRSDLLRKYGYDHPPRTWDELEGMAKRIQSGERAEGRKDFWGYVWQGVAGEALTCNALEWQAAEGGGRIIESDRTISVNNPAAIRAWQRAKHWIGSISPPAVVAYREIDSMNAFGSGRAAFNRVWLGTTITNGGQYPVYWRNLNPIVETGFMSLPGGPGGSAGTLGGSGLSVSMHSAHRSEAIEFVRFLVRAQIRSNEKRKSAPRAEFEIANPHPVSGPRGDSQKPIQYGINLVSRPSVEAGDQYKQVSAAYAAAVHAVLTGQKRAPEAAADLEKQLVQITGFRTGPPKTWK